MKYELKIDFYKKIHLTGELYLDKYSLVGASQENQTEFQKDIESTLKDLELSRSGKKKGDIYNKEGEKVGIYKVIHKNYS